MALRYDANLDMYALEDTQPLPVLRDFVCPKCGKGTSRIGRACMDCIADSECRAGGCACGECCEA